VTKLVFDRRMQVAAGGMAVITAGGAAAGAESNPIEPVPVPSSDQAEVRVLRNHPMTVEEGLARHGLIVQTPPALRLNMLETRALAARSIHDILRVPHVRLEYGMGKHRANEHVRDLQEVLKKLGFFHAKPNGIYGPKTKKAVKRLQLTFKMLGKPTEFSGNFGPRTRRSLTHYFDTRDGQRALRKAHKQLLTMLKFKPGKRYAPHSKEAKKLFRAAAAIAGVPASWAHSRGLHNILSHESNGVVGVPNYTYGWRKNKKSEWPKIYREIQRGQITAVSTATGLGQLLNYNVRTYYPNGVRGLGHPIQEAAGMLRYIKARYGSPERAWHLYNTLHEGY
jgi:hypothetical protein